MTVAALRRFAPALILMLAAPMRAHAWMGGRVPSGRAEADMFLGVCFVIFLGGVIGAAWGASRSAWGAFMGFVAGSFGGLAAILIGAVAFTLFT